jgi:2-polyprenyl-3-methyl-5-hydroxy-6-metoxy-1,4-benzoquinol methylase
MKTEHGVPVGNQVDKSALKNPLARAMVHGFDRALLACLEEVRPESVHEVGCGEGRLCRLIRKRWDVPLRGTDFSAELIAALRAEQWNRTAFVHRGIHDLVPGEDSADVVVCCEVLEHVREPERALVALRDLGARAYVLSVPREPLWRALNMARGKYLRDWGNTPGHVNHWSPRGFLRFLQAGGFRVRSLRQPIPWTMVAGDFSE